MSCDLSSISQYNSHYDAVVSGDLSGMVEYWSSPSSGYTFPKTVLFQHKMDTDLYEFVKVPSTTSGVWECSSVTCLFLPHSIRRLHCG